MITQIKHNGGARYLAIAADISVHRESARVQTLAPTGTRNVTLPNATYLTKGGPWYYFQNVGPGTLTIKSFGGATVTSVSSGQVGVLYLTDNSTSAGTWCARVSAYNTTVAFANSTRLAATEDEEVRTFNPACLEDQCGDDAAKSGVLVPMFQNSCDALNYAREPVRAADWSMADSVPVRFLRDKFAMDTAHPYGGTALSSEFWDALYNDNKFHTLTYEGSINGTSRHWYHIHRSGGAWGGNASLSVKRRWWKRERQYTVGNTTYTLQIRFVVEHTCNPEPLEAPLTPATGGTSSATEGLWGGLLLIYVFTDEVNPSWADGSTFTPTGAAAPITFTRTDPCVWGTHVGEGQAERFCHPQLVIAGVVPTTFHAPCGIDWIPKGDEDRAYCYQWANGAPWSAAGSGQAERNIVFGGSSVPYRAMTLGGDFPTSEPMEHICIENGLGVGRTVAKPIADWVGWDETAGTLTQFSGVEIYFCNPGQNEADACQGHPAEPFKTIGGSHRCFRNKATDYCCISIGPAARIVVTEKCVRYTVELGDFTTVPPETGCAGTLCDTLSTDCEVIGSFLSTFDLPLEDYNLDVDNVSGALRIIQWKLLVTDPAAVYFNYTYSHTNVGDFVQEVGTVSFTSGTVTTTAVNAAKVLKNVVRYAPVGAAHTDGYIEATLDLSTPGPLGLGWRMTVDGSDNATGYALVLDRGAGTVKLFKYVANVATQLAQVIVALPNGNSLCRLTVDGSTISATYTTLTAVVGTIEAEDCAITAGAPALVALNNSTGSIWRSPVIGDQTDQTVAVTASLSPTMAAGNAPNTICRGATQACNQEINANCGTCNEGLHCNCTYIYHQLTGTYTLSVTDPLPSVLDVTNTLGGGLPPGICDGATPSCTPPVLSPCDECPPPHAQIQLIFPPSCGDAYATNSGLCPGVELWYYDPVVCA